MTLPLKPDSGASFELSEEQKTEVKSRHCNSSNNPGIYIFIYIEMAL